MRRREFIAGLGGAVIWPLAARAQKPAMPVIGILGAASLRARSYAFSAAFASGLGESGYVQGRNVAVEYRSVEGHFDRLPAIAAEFVQREVAVITTSSTPALVAAKAATKSIPIVFSIGTDPVASGFVASLSHPGANITGVFNLSVEVMTKRLQMLHELVPTASSIALLTNPINADLAEAERRELHVAAAILGVRLLVVKASYPAEFEPAFETVAREQAGALIVGGDLVFSDYADQIVALAARYAVPAMYPYPKDFTPAGGLMSYGTDGLTSIRQLAIYAGRILKGEKPADLPVQQVTNMELAINMKTAKALGLTFPLDLLALADRVIE
jgi:putative tryptophan/tyrosine transport system substrate-binding protein